MIIIAFYFLVNIVKSVCMYKIKNTAGLPLKKIRVSDWLMHRVQRL